MLREQLNKIKNLIVLKFIIYGLIFIIMISFLPTSISHMISSNYDLKKAKLLVNNIREKVDYFKKGDDLIIAANYYKKLLKEPANELCLEHLSLTESLKDLAANAELNPKFEVKISTPTFSNDEIHTEDQWVIVKNSNITVNYTANEIKDFLQVAEKMYESLPKYTLIESLKLTRDEVLTMENLGGLTQGSLLNSINKITPKLTQGKIKFRTKSIKVDNSRIFE